MTDFRILDRLKITVVAKVFIFRQIAGGADNMGGDARSLQLTLDAMRVLLNLRDQISLKIRRNP